MTLRRVGMRTSSLLAVLLCGCSAWAEGSRGEGAAIEEGSAGPIHFEADVRWAGRQFGFGWREVYGLDIPTLPEEHWRVNVRWRLTERGDRILFRSAQPIQVLRPEDEAATMEEFERREVQACRRGTVVAFRVFGSEPFRIAYVWGPNAYFVGLEDAETCEGALARQSGFTEWVDARIEDCDPAAMAAAEDFHRHGALVKWCEEQP